MPNWCENDLKIKGTEKELIEFDEKVKANDYKLFKTFVPIPQELENTQSPNLNPTNSSQILIAKYGADNWYDWQVENWGCKWDVELNQGTFSKNKKGITYFFDSPWSPPIPGITKTSKLLPNLEFKLKYEEPGMRFRGTTTIKNGKILTDKCKNY